MKEEHREEEKRKDGSKEGNVGEDLGKKGEALHGEYKITRFSL